MERSAGTFTRLAASNVNHRQKCGLGRPFRDGPPGKTPSLKPVFLRYVDFSSLAVFGSGAFI